LSRSFSLEGAVEQLAESQQPNALQVLQPERLAVLLQAHRLEQQVVQLELGQAHLSVPLVDFSANPKVT